MTGTLSQPQESPLAEPTAPKSCFYLCHSRLLPFLAHSVPTAQFCVHWVHSSLPGLPLLEDLKERPHTSHFTHVPTDFLPIFAPSCSERGVGCTSSSSAQSTELHKKLKQKFQHLCNSLAVITHNIFMR